MGGKAYLIGAGPGDPRLLTLRAVDILVKADVVFVDDEEGRVSEVAADTLVVFMCQHTVVGIARELLRAGRSPETPAAIVRGATRDAQEVYTASLGALAALPADWHAALDDALPTLAIIGDVVSFAEALAWRARPLRLQRGAA